MDSIHDLILITNLWWRTIQIQIKWILNHLICTLVSWEFIFFSANQVLLSPLYLPPVHLFWFWFFVCFLILMLKKAKKKSKQKLVPLLFLFDCMQLDSHIFWWIFIFTLLSSCFVKCRISHEISFVKKILISLFFFRNVPSFFVCYTKNFSIFSV